MIFIWLISIWASDLFWQWLKCAQLALHVGEEHPQTEHASQGQWGWECIPWEETQTLCKAHGHNFLFYLTLTFFLNLVLWSFFCFFSQGYILAGTKSKLLRKNKESTSNIRVTTQRISSAAVWGPAFHVCFLVKILGTLLRSMQINADARWGKFAFNQPGVLVHLGVLGHLIECPACYYFRNLSKWNQRGGKRQCSPR